MWRLSKVLQIMLAKSDNFVVYAWRFYSCFAINDYKSLLYYSKGQNEKNGSDKSLDQTSANMDMNDQVDSSMYVLLFHSSKSFMI